MLEVNITEIGIKSSSLQQAPKSMSSFPKCHHASFTYPEPPRSFVGSLLNLHSFQGDMVNSSLFHLFAPVLNWALPGKGEKNRERNFSPLLQTAIHTRCRAAEGRDGLHKINTTIKARWILLNGGNTGDILGKLALPVVSRYPDFPFSYFS